MINDSKIRTMFKWPGGKRLLLKSILAAMPDNINTYIEPFIGGGTVFLAVAPEHAIIADANPELINAYKCVKHHPHEVIYALSDLNFNTKEFYNKTRSWNPDDDISRAARFIYLNKTCFNGLWRVNSKGQFNVPFGNRPRVNIVDVDGIMSMSKALSGTDVLLADFRDVLLKHTPDGSFVYLDPPYFNLTPDSFTAYTKNSFTENDQVDLRDACDDLNSRGCTFLYNNADSMFIRDLFADYRITPVNGRTSIHGGSAHRGRTNELIITNY